MTFKDKLRRRSEKSKEVKALKNFSPYDIIIEPIITEKAKELEVKTKRPVLDKKGNKIKETKEWISKAGNKFVKEVVKTEVVEKKIPKYIFKVHKSATKTDIKHAIAKIYNLDLSDIKKVNTMIVPWKTKYFRWKAYRRPSYKKAIVTLKEGKTIKII